MMKPGQFLARAGLALAALCALTTAPRAQADYPNKPIRVVIGFPAGSGADILGRYYTQKLQELSKQAIIVDNKGGATANIALRFTKDQPADGYTMMFMANSNMAGSRYLIKDLTVDTVKDFAPVASFAQITFVMVVSPKSPLNTVNDMVAFLKKKGDTIYGYTNQTALLSSELFKQMTGVTTKPVAYKTAPETMKDITDQTLDFVIMDGTFAAGQVRNKALKTIAVTTKVRSPTFPDTPTMQEQGLKDFEFAPWWAAYVPAGTPEPARAKLEAWFHQINRMPETAEFLAKVGAIVNDDTGKEADERLKAEIPRWAPIVKAAGIVPQ